MVEVRDLNMMLSKSLVKHKDTILYIVEVESGKEAGASVVAFDLKEQKLVRLEGNVGEFKAPPRIGYVNTGLGAVYAYRTPARDYKVGLTTSTIRLRYGDRIEARATRASKELLIHSLRSPEMFKAISGEYPSLEEALKEADEKDYIVAFDRQFAVNSKRTLYYRGKVVGGVTKQGSIRFSEDNGDLIYSLRGMKC